MRKEGAPPGRETVVLVGNANVGKSVVFGHLTGRYVNVSNYPGTTVEVTRGEAKERGVAHELIDTPGVYSLHPMSEDERVTRDILMEEPGARILQVCDAKNMRRSLLVTIQLAEMDLPFTLSVNMVDEARERGVMPRLDRIASELGVEVIPTVAVRGKGIDRLLPAALAGRRSAARVNYGPHVEEAVEGIGKLLPAELPVGRRALAVMLLCGDDSLAPWLAKNVSPDAVKGMNAVRNRLVELDGPDVAYRVNQVRLAWADRMLAEAGVEEGGAKGGGLAQSIGVWSMHPVYGVPILLFVLFLAYEFVGVFGAGTLVDFLQNRFFGQWVVPAVSSLAKRFIPWEIVRDFLVGPYGLVPVALSYAVAIVLPIVGTFFFGFGILEDSGYLPRLAVVVDRLFKRIGCNGKAILPLVLGLGCDTMATLTARILETKKERVIVTLLLALGIPCSAQLGVILGMLSSIGLAAAFTWLAIVLLVLLLVGYLAAKVLPGETADFILEIPPMRVPRLGNLLVKTMARIEWYLREAVPLFVVGTAVLFVAARTGVLEWLRRAGEPVVTGVLDLPPQTSDAFLIGFLRRDYGAAGLYHLSKTGLLSPRQVVVSLVTMTLFIPCLANFLVIIKEHGTKVAVAMALFIFPFALLVGAAVNLAARLLGATFA